LLKALDISQERKQRRQKGLFLGIHSFQRKLIRFNELAQGLQARSCQRIPQFDGFGFIFLNSWVTVFEATDQYQSPACGYQIVIVLLLLLLIGTVIAVITAVVVVGNNLEIEDETFGCRTGTLQVGIHDLLTNRLNDVKIEAFVRRVQQRGLKSHQGSVTDFGIHMAETQHDGSWIGIFCI
jgi:hypothetical protein